jgi:hypothetical protein
LLSADLHITNDSRMLAYLASRRPSHINESGSQSAVQIGVVGATVDRVDEDKTLMEVINSVLEPQLVRVICFRCTPDCIVYLLHICVVRRVKILRSPIRYAD